MTQGGSADTPDTAETLVTGTSAGGDSSGSSVLSALRERMSEVHGESTRLGRYVVIERIGAGGVGIVHAAYDPELDRKVAVKLLRTASSVNQARLLREARAMARLSHPNVVQVHEVGQRDDELFVAMEFVDGVTLAEWIRDHRDDWRAVLRACLQAGEGLVAAHAAGVVHRDFKPANVLCGVDGRVRVTDFGLAGGTVSESMTDAETTRSEDTGGDADTPIEAHSRSLTRTGAVLGTPAYMSPEQHRGDDLDGRADQFAFCVTAWEGLFAVHPFAANSYHHLLERIEQQDIEAPKGGAKVPARVRRLLETGLKVDPEHRHPSMRALLDALSAAAFPRSRAWSVLAAGIVVGAVAVAIAAVGGESAGGACDDPSDHLTDVWDDATAERVHSAFERSGAPFANDAWSRVRPALDHYAARWSTGYTSACELTGVRGEQSETMLDLRMACYKGRLAELAGLTRILIDGDADVIEHAPDAALGLGDLGACDRIEDLSRLDPLPANADARAGIAETREQVARATALRKAGKFDDGLDIAQQAHARANTLGYRPLLAESLEAVGLLHQRLGADEQAVASLTDAYFEAQAAHHRAVALPAASRLTHILGHTLQRFPEAHLWHRHARLLLAGMDPPDAHEGVLLDNFGGLLKAEGKYGEAEAAHVEALAMLEQARGADSPSVATALLNLASVLLERNRNADGEAHLRRALEIRRHLYGDDHPAVATVLNNLGTALQFQRKGEQALARYEEALRIREATLPADHPRVARVHNNLANALLELGRPEAALPHAETALRMLEAKRGADHPVLVYPLNVLGAIHSRMEQHDLAIAAYDRALAIAREGLGPDHIQVMNVLVYLGWAHIEADDPRAGLEVLEGAKNQAAAGKDTPVNLTREIDRGIAEAHLALGQARKALPMLERLLDDATADEDAVALELADLRFSLARARWALGQRDDVDDLVAAARTTYATEPGTGSAKLADWLRERR